MEREEALRRGIVAATLLDSEDVMLFLNELKEDIRSSVFNTEPEASEKRQHLYYDHRAVESFIDRLKTYRAAAEHIVKQADMADREIDN